MEAWPLRKAYVLQVSEAGDAVYAFPSNFAGVIQSRSFWLKIAPVLARLKETAGWLARVSFGAALVASVALVWITIFALLTASSQDNDRNNSRSAVWPPCNKAYKYDIQHENIKRELVMLHMQIWDCHQKTTSYQAKQLVG